MLFYILSIPICITIGFKHKNKRIYIYKRVDITCMCQCIKYTEERYMVTVQSYGELLVDSKKYEYWKKYFGGSNFDIFLSQFRDLMFDCIHIWYSE